MQDIHSIDSHGGGAGGRLFAGGGAGADRRSRLPHHHQQDMKCPRCDSLNTKFCYYNNYNLSQPRHFCKNCRRYWTKGGVLRNVPVGGGIRKTKRSGKSKSKATTTNKTSNSENSSSDSSSLTATATATVTTTTTTEVSVSNSTNSTPAKETVLNFNESSTQFFNTHPITTFDPLMLNQSSTGNMFSEIGTFTEMMTTSTDQLPLEFNSTIPFSSSFQLHQQNPDQIVENHHHQWTVDPTRLLDQTAKIELSDWQDNTDHEGLFDLTGTVDQSYWNQTQWNHHDHDHDHHLNYLR